MSWTPYDMRIFVKQTDRGDWAVLFDGKLLKRFPDRERAYTYAADSAAEEVSDIVNGAWVHRDVKVTKYPPKHRRAVRCIETGKVFDSMTAASLWLGKSAVYLRDVFQGKAKNHTPYSFELVEVSR